tara:strand:- start:30 stop:233 length:204 start_codon:yes stop_codon:yes gene_type:complete
MIKLIIFGIGFVFVFEGLIYFLFAKNMKKMFLIISNIETEKIRTFSSILLIVGLCLIYFTIKFYNLS